MPTFGELMEQALSAVPPRGLGHGECRDAGGKQCTLCCASRVDYDRELPAKQSALQRFWIQHHLPKPAPDLAPALQPRDYRFSSRRRCFADDRAFQLALVELDEGRFPRPFMPLRCRLEPLVHGSIYARIKSELSSNRYPELREALLHVVIKGLDDAPGVVFSLADFQPPILREVNRLSKLLTRHFPKISAVWIHRHSGGLGYALGSTAGAAGGSWRKLYGQSALQVDLPGGPLRFSPLCFTQANSGMIGPLVQCAQELLPESGAGRLLDLYCGYGLFALHLQRNYRQVLGVEGSPEAVRWAEDNARRLNMAQVRFRQLDIRPERLAAGLPRGLSKEDILLDPPRSGPAAGVIALLATRQPQRVLHVCCDIERVPLEIRAWAEQGYHLNGARTLDLFPGTPAIETLLLFVTDR